MGKEVGRGKRGERKERKERKKGKEERGDLHASRFSLWGRGSWLLMFVRGIPSIPSSGGSR